MLALICYGISFLVYVTILLWGLFGEHYGGYFGYGLVSFYVAIPILSFVMALILNLNVTNTYLKWLYPFVFALFGLAIAKIVMSDWISDLWLLCILPPFMGAGIGFLIFTLKNK